MKHLKSFLAASAKAPAVAGLLMIVPSTIYLISVFLKYGLGYGFMFDPMDSFYNNRIVESFIFFMPLAALVLNVIFILAFKGNLEEGALRLNFEIKLRVLNLGVSLVSLFYVALMFSYVISENIGLYYRTQM